MSGRLTEGVADGIYDNAPEFAEVIKTYLEGVTYVDNEASQTIVGTPIEDSENSKFYIPLAFGVSSDIMSEIKAYNEAEGEHQYALYSTGKVIINYDNNITAECMGVYYDELENGANIIGTLIEVDDSNTTTISNDNIDSISIYDGETLLENLGELKPVSGCYFPDVVEFTPAEQNEGE